MKEKMSVRRVLLEIYDSSPIYIKTTYLGQIFCNRLGHINLMTKNRSFIVTNDVSLDSFQVFDSNESFFDFTLEMEWNGLIVSGERNAKNRRRGRLTLRQLNEGGFPWKELTIVGDVEV